jgi:hypothetical protein
MEQERSTSGLAADEHEPQELEGLWPASAAPQWLAYAYPCQRFAPHLAVRHA